ncbi:MAG: ABC transporter ATP-binding protein, partial [Erysipelotrichaceae bacterium]|nr:ABC transporter ATP-binding protein [Erysipelotrichaceae bacterium]
DKKNMDKFRSKNYREALVNENQLLMEIYINNQQINKLISDITQLEIVDFNEIPFSLEDYFMQFYENKNTFEEVQ